MNFQNINVRKDGRLAIITIQRPEVLNAINTACIREMDEALNMLKDDGEVQCIIFTGEGSKSFVAGADIDELRQKKMVEMLISEFQDLFNRIEDYPKPTIAMVNGYALGGGCELAMACDLRIASTNAKFGLPELNLGIIPGAGGTQRLARLVGKGRALYMILTGQTIDAQQALTYGLVNEVVEPDRLYDRVKEVAEKILSKGPLAVELARLTVKQGLETDMHKGLILEKIAQAVLFGTEDKNEGMDAFLEKRKAQFKGR